MPLSAKDFLNAPDDAGSGPVQPDSAQQPGGASPGMSAADFLNAPDTPTPSATLASRHGAGGSWGEAGEGLSHLDKAALAAHDSTTEREMYLQKVYGKENVRREWGKDGKAELILKKDGKDVRIPSDFGFIADTEGHSPEMAGAMYGGIEGGLAGTAIMPGPGTVVGAAIGAGVGALGGYAAKQVAKEAAGTYSKTTGEAVEQGLDAYAMGAASEVGGRAVAKGVKTALGGKVIPRFMSGVTDESAAKAEKAWAGNARPSYVSIAPGSRRLARIEIDADKLTGKSLKNDERNFQYVQSEIRDSLVNSGLPKGQVDGIMKHISDPNSPPFVGREAGEMLKKSVDAQVATLESHVGTAAAESDRLIDARLANIDRMIEAHPPGMLADDTADMIKNAKSQFSQAATGIYEKIHAMLGEARVVPTAGIRAAAKQITSLLPKTAVASMVKEMSKLAEKEVAPEDAVLLKEFGIDIGTDKISLRDAQRIRTILFERGGATDLTRNTVKGDHLTVAHAVEDAIQEAGEDPQAASAIGALNQADRWYKQNISKFKDTAVKNLVKQTKSGMPPDPQKIVNIIASPGQTARVATLRQVLGDGVWKRVQSAHMGMVMTDATSMGEQGGRVVDGMKLLDFLKKPENVNVFRAVHGDAAAADIREVAMMLSARKGTLSPQTLMNGDIKTALTTLRANEKALDDYLKTNLLSELRDPRKTGEDVFRWAVEPGKESRVMEVARQFGENSPQMAELRQAAMEMLARNANMKGIIEDGTTAITRSLNEFSQTQRRLLFGDSEKDLRAMQDVISYMFPLKSDVGMAGMHAGSVLEKPLLGGRGNQPWRVRDIVNGRLYKQTMAAMMRLIVQHPTMARWLVTGRSQDTHWIANTAAIFRRLTQLGIIDETPDQPEAQRQNPEKSKQLQQARQKQEGIENGDDGGSGQDDPNAPGISGAGQKRQGKTGGVGSPP